MFLSNIILQIVLFIHVRTEFVEPYDEVYDEINAEEESNSNSNGNTYLEVTSGYEDLGQMSAINPYNQLQQTKEVDRDREIEGYLTSPREIANSDNLTRTQLYSDDSEDYMEPVDTTDESNYLQVTSINCE